MAQVKKDNKYTSTALDTSHCDNILNQCSRSAPTKVEGKWNPSLSDVLKLENNFQKVLKLKGNEWNGIGEQVDSLAKYAFQYVGIVIKGEKFIYVNAFPKVMLEKSYYNYKDEWKSSPVKICDGGPNFWGVLFKIKDSSFSELSFNGP